MNLRPSHTVSATVLLLLGLTSPSLAEDADRHFPCIPVPTELFESASHVFPDGFPDGGRIAGSGDTLGVLVPEASGEFRLVLIRAGEKTGEVQLRQPPQARFPRAPFFSLGDDGEVAVLSVRELIAVYDDDGELVSLIEPDEEVAADSAAAHKGDLYWTAIPDELAITQHLISTGGFEAVQQYLHGASVDDVTAFLNRHPAPLLIRSDLDGTEREVLLQLGGSDLRDGAMALEHTLQSRVRSDGKLWAAGIYTGEILVLRASGAVDDTRSLPDALALAGDDPAVRKEREQEMEDAVEASRDDALTNRGANAQRKDRGEVHATGVVTPSLWFHNIAVRDRDLFIVPATTDPPPGALLVINENHTAPICYQLPEALVSKPLSQQFAATNDAIWLRKPFGFVRWSDLVALAPSEERYNGRTPLK